MVLTSRAARTWFHGGAATSSTASRYRHRAAAVAAVLSAGGARVQVIPPDVLNTSNCALRYRPLIINFG